MSHSRPAVVQGVLTAIVALLLYGRMVAILGTTSGAAFVGLTPAMTAVLAIPVLLEWPSVTDWMAIALVSLGVYLVSGGRTTRSISDRSPKLQSSVAGVDKMNGLVA